MTTVSSRLLVSLILIGSAFGVGLVMGRASIGSSHGAWPGGDNELRRADIADAGVAGLEPQVSDAVRRWSQKSRMTEKQVRELHLPRSMFIPTRNQGQGMLCIELRLKPRNLGGSPVYCYQADVLKPGENMRLVAEYSDVE